MVFEPAHFLTFPAGNGPIIYAQAFVRNDQVFAYANDFAETATGRAGPQRAVETEEVLIGFTETHSVELETVHEAVQLSVETY